MRRHGLPSSHHFVHAAAIEIRADRTFESTKECTSSSGSAQSNLRETPIFTTVDDEAIPLFIEHGADLSIRNNKGQDVVEAANERGPARQEALRKALEKLVKH